MKAVPYMQELPEYKAIEDDEGRQAAFAKFIKRQKAGLNTFLRLGRESSHLEPRDHHLQESPAIRLHLVTIMLI